MIKYKTVVTVPKSNRQIHVVERDKIVTPNTQIHDLSLFSPGKSGERSN